MSKTNVWRALQGSMVFSLIVVAHACNEPRSELLDEAVSVDLPHKPLGENALGLSQSRAGATKHLGATESADQHSLWEEGVPVWLAPGEEQWCTVVDFRTVEVTDIRKSTQTGEVLSITHIGTANFDILRMASAHDDVLAFAGLDDNGDFVLERWMLIPTPSAPLSGAQTMGAGPSGPSGGPIGDPEDVTLAPKRFQKTRIFEGQLASMVAGLDFDVEGRFLLALLREGSTTSLWHFDNVPSTTPSLLLDSISIPQLASSKQLAKFDHQMLGRIWVMDDQAAYTIRIVLVDSENDGVFDGAPIIGDRSYFSATGIDAYHLWDDLLGP